MENLYFTDWKYLKSFIEAYRYKKINDNLKLKSKNKIGLKINNSGILKIQKNISKYLNKKNSSTNNF